MPRGTGGVANPAAVGGAACCARSEYPDSTVIAMAAVMLALRIRGRKPFHDGVLQGLPATESAIRTFKSGRNEVIWLFILGKRIMSHKLRESSSINQVEQTSFKVPFFPGVKIVDQPLKGVGNVFQELRINFRTHIRTPPYVRFACNFPCAALLSTGGAVRN